MSISRKHLEIYYNFEAKRWEFKVLGKNGCFVNRVVHNPESEPGTLDSGSLLQFGGGGEAGAADYIQGVSVCFLLPRSGEAPAGKRKMVHSRKRPKIAGVSNGVLPFAVAGGVKGEAVPEGGWEPKPEGVGAPPEAGQSEAPAEPQDEEGIPAPELRGSGRRSPSPPDAVAQLL